MHKLKYLAWKALLCSNSGVDSQVFRLSLALQDTVVTFLEFLVVLIQLDLEVFIRI